ncbi:MAG: Hsp20/alpha crystallin family protein [Proteobacteria bacterium]|nr:Hsp20/alpha crystallin family protein [Pseudomonadota bacterium]
MAIIKWSPFKEFTDLKREMDSLFDEFFGRRTLPSRRAKPSRASGVYFPPVDVYEKTDEIVIKVGIPGVKKEDLEVTLLENTLTVKGQRSKDAEVREGDYYYLEQHYGSFSRSITFPVELDPEGMKASYKDGVLEIIIPKSKKEKRREIEVRVS